jgi:hypothetical protein
MDLKCIGLQQIVCSVDTDSGQKRTKGGPESRRG